jgi:hypothetical protein
MAGGRAAAGLRLESQGKIPVGSDSAQSKEGRQLGSASALLHPSVLTSGLLKGTWEA